MEALPARITMDLTSGAKLGPYEIVSAIGKGGMGEVWKARDPRLNRDVAIKVSARQFTDRFEREARAIAALNHPNICTIFDVGPNYLVMEFVAGPTLAERIDLSNANQGPIPLEEALGIARQIADALEAAHEKGIVHRDLKPANIKIQPNGAVKVLDFGLAKSAAESEVTADSPTMLSVGGMILGTAGYMAPEQARGKEVDKRADIWAFGVVLYEMVTGKRLFESETVSDTLAAVLKEEPDLQKTPIKVQRLLRRCLEKDPKRRLRDIGDMGLLLEAEGAVAASSRSRFGRSLPWIVAAALLVAALGFSSVAWRQYSEETPVMRMTLQTPEKAQINSAGTIPMISPDGRHVAFAATVEGKTGLWIRDLDALGARQLPGTDGAGYPFWSPDSRWVAFFAGGKLKKIDVTGGPALILCDAGSGRGGSWSREDLIVYGTAGGGLFRVPASGGTPTLLSERDTTASEGTLRSPWFLPDGRHFLYTARNDDPEKSRVYVESIDAKPGSRTRREILAAGSNAVYVPQPRLGWVGGRSRGFLLFMRGNTLMSQPFDAAKAQTTGGAVSVAERVDYLPTYSQGQFSASENGILAYTSGASFGSNVQLTWFDRTGKPGSTVGTPGPIGGASLSPDDSKVAIDRQDASGLWDIWLNDLARGTTSRFTFGPGSRQNPLWSPDGSEIVFISNRNNNLETSRKSASGVGQEEVLDKEQRPHRADDWSRDGRYLIEEVVDPRTNNDVWVLPIFGDRKPFPYINTEFRELNAKLSPDGRFLAYVSDESKRNEVYVQTFPEHGGKWQISTGGGDHPVWSRDGRELYFISADRKMMAVEVKGDGKRFEASVPKPLFEVREAGQFDVSKDGRFLIHVPQDQAAANVPLTVIVNWQAALKK